MSEAPSDASVFLLDSIVNIFRQSKNVLAICGAGISVSCGIPDFRSKGIGIYNTLDCAQMGLPSAELLFDSEYFEIDPLPFYKFASRTLLPQLNTTTSSSSHIQSQKLQPSISHYFFKLLELNGKLLRLYTQNIDGLERIANIQNVIECHGTMKQFQCINKKCNKKVDCDNKMIDFIQNGNRLIKKTTKRTSKDNSIANNDGNVCYCSKCNSTLKPCITFFGDNAPVYFERAMNQDIKKMKQIDLIIVTGTSLLVGGSVYELLKHFNNHNTHKSTGNSSYNDNIDNSDEKTNKKLKTNKNTKSNSIDIPKKLSKTKNLSNSSICRILINKELITDRKNFPFQFDYILLGECDEIFEYLSTKLGWDLKSLTNISHSNNELHHTITTQETISTTTNKNIKSTKTIKNNNGTSISMQPLVSSVASNDINIQPTDIPKQLSLRKRKFSISESIKDNAPSTQKYSNKPNKTNEVVVSATNYKSVCDYDDDNWKCTTVRDNVIKIEKNKKY